MRAFCFALQWTFPREIVESCRSQPNFIVLRPCELNELAFFQGLADKTRK
jgi:hypothetical protein